MKMKTKLFLMLCAAVILLLLLALAWFTPSGKTVLSTIVWRLRGENGTVYWPLPNGGMSQCGYDHGLREGVWRAWDKDGRLVNQCEYRNGKPWNGVCQIRDRKGFLGEYKNGNPWNGAYSGFTRNTNGDCFIDGQEMSLEAYRQHYQISSNQVAIGIDVWGPK